MVSPVSVRAVRNAGHAVGEHYQPRESSATHLELRQPTIGSRARRIAKRGRSCQRSSVRKGQVNKLRGNAPEDPTYLRHTWEDFLRGTS